MFESDAVRSAGHPVLDAAACVSAAAQAVLGSAATSLTLAEVQRAAAELQGAAAQLEAARLHVVRLLLERDDSPRTGARTTAWLKHALHVGAARADVAAARATDPVSGDLRHLGAALAEGAVTRPHVDVAVRALRQLPTGLVSERGEEIDRLLVSHAVAFSPANAEVLAKTLVHTVAPDGLEAFADEAHERRSFSYRTDRTGMTRFQGQLPAESAAGVVTVLDRLASPDRHLPSCPDGQSGGAGPGAGAAAELDQRTLDQRHADALVEMGRLAAAHLAVEAPHLEPARVVITCTAEQLTHPDLGEPCSPDAGSSTTGVEGGGDAAHRSPGPATSELVGPITGAALQRHACDAVLERVVLDRHGAVVRMESLGRLATRAQRRALAARDGGCARPGCSAPASWTEAHHVVWWSRGGATVIENLVLLCPRHHTEIHREQWVITMRDGVPWFIPPRWVDPAQAPVRNSLHTAVGRTRRAGQRLVMGQVLAADDVAGPEPPLTAG